MLHNPAWKMVGPAALTPGLAFPPLMQPVNGTTEGLNPCCKRGQVDISLLIRAVNLLDEFCQRRPPWQGDPFGESLGLKYVDERVYTDVGQESRTYKERYRPALNALLLKYALNTPKRMSHFFGQAAQETYFFMLVRESATRVSTAIRENHISVQSETGGFLQITPENRAQLRYFAEAGQTGYYEGDAASGTRPQAMASSSGGAE
jgi:hypothetical protein